jgi:hypothetical protein
MRTPTVDIDICIVNADAYSGSCAANAAAEIILCLLIDPYLIVAIVWAGSPTQNKKEQTQIELLAGAGGDATETTGSEQGREGDVTERTTRARRTARARIQHTSSKSSSRLNIFGSRIDVVEEPCCQCY